MRGYSWNSFLQYLLFLELVSAWCNGIDFYVWLESLIKLLNLCFVVSFKIVFNYSAEIDFVILS
jgi:hypothetical protein